MSDSGPADPQETGRDKRGGTAVPPGPGTGPGDVVLVGQDRPWRITDELPPGLDRRGGLDRWRTGQPAFSRDRGAGAPVLGGRRHVPGVSGEPPGGPGRRERVRVLRRPAVRERP